eukprot:404676-Prymnesium_polylepis.1
MASASAATLWRTNSAQLRRMASGLAWLGSSPKKVASLRSIAVVSSCSASSAAARCCISSWKPTIACRNRWPTSLSGSDPRIECASVARSSSRSETGQSAISFPSNVTPLCTSLSMRTSCGVAVEG